MSGVELVLPIILPLGASFLCLLFGKVGSRGGGIVALAVSTVNLALAVLDFPLRSSLYLPWFEPGFTFAVKLTAFSAFLLVAVAGFGFLVTLYSTLFLRGRRAAHRFFFYALFTLGLANGVLLADDLVLLLIFWEGLLLTTFGMIVTGRAAAYPTAIKSFVIVALTDLCLMAGIILTGTEAHTFQLSAIHLPATGPAALAFVLLLVGALGKAGAMPFHSWIPDAAVDAPLPFMAFLPASLEKLLGIYLLARITLDLFAIEPGSWLSLLMMIVGAATILLAVLMALAQKSYKRLLAYHAISQVGYMVLGIGTALPVGIVGGLFHLINNAIYKSGLFLTAGSVERQAGTTMLAELGGLSRKMPVTFALFVVLAASISGVPPLNGFFSKELVYEATLERGWPFYAAALLGSLLTAASFLKLGHAVYLGAARNNRRAALPDPPGADPAVAGMGVGAGSDATGDAGGAPGDIAGTPANGAGAAGEASGEATPVREAPWQLLVPIGVLAAACLLFGVGNALPLRALIEPILGAHLGGQSFAGPPRSLPLTLATIGVLCVALASHLYGVRRSGSGLGAADHVIHAPLLGRLYAVALAGRLDPYAIGRFVVRFLAQGLHRIDRGVDWVYERLIVGVKTAVSGSLSRAQSGSYQLYLVWMVVAAILLVLAVVR